MISPNFSINNSNIPGANSIFDAILKIGKQKIIQKGQVIIKKGSHSYFFFYVKSGIFKSVAMVNDKAYILGFTFADDIHCCPTSLLKELPNNFNIQAVTDSEVLICELKDFEKFSNKEDYDRVIKYLLVQNLSFVERRLVDAISLNAEQAYRLMLLKQPDKIKQLPLSYVASYLGISLERLSRIRKKIRFDIDQILQ